MKTETDFPFGDTVRVSFEKADAESETPDDIRKIYIRIPAYTSSFAVKKNGENIAFENRKGYACLPADFSAGDILEIKMEMPPVFLSANPAVRADRGRVALVKGPVVYCLEEEDNGTDLEALLVDTAAPVQEVYDGQILGGTLTLEADGYIEKYDGFDENRLYQTAAVVREPKKLKFIPYAFWDNRTPGEMLVWVRRKD